jgi:hypothetical protein
MSDPRRDSIVYSLVEPEFFLTLPGRRPFATGIERLPGRLPFCARSIVSAGA